MDLSVLESKQRKLFEPFLDVTRRCKTMTKKKAKRTSGRLQKGEKLGREKQRVKKYKRKQQLKKKGKKPKKY